MTLVDLSTQIRSLIKWFLIALAIIFVLWLVWILVSSVTKLIFKPRAEDIAFGNISPPLFTKTYGKLVSETFELSITLPSSEKALKGLVYKVSNPASLDSAAQEKIMRTFGLLGGKKEMDGNLLTSLGENNESKLQINTALRSIHYKFNYKDQASTLSGKTVSDKKTLVKKLKSILTEISLSAADLDMENPSAKFLEINGESKQESTFGSATAVELSFYRKVNGEPATGDPPLKVLFGGDRATVLEFDYTYSPLEKAPSAYPIISETKAWEIAKSGLAFVDTTESFKKVALNKLSLLYWESAFYQPFLQPVWVFDLLGETKKGEKKDLKAFLPAIDPTLISPQ